MLELAVGFLVPLIAAAIAIRYEQHPAVVRGSALADNALASRWMPLVCGLITALIMWWGWSGSHFIPNIADESAYVLQAEIFSKGAWTLPARALPEFFEQMHVFVTPFFAAKYFPGQSLLLVPGVLIGFPTLVPLLLIFGSGALVFALARRLTNGWKALLVWAVWTTARANLRFLPSYLSETTTAFLWLLGWWALYSWYVRPSRRMLILVSVCTAWCMITRPLTGLVFAVPVVVVVILFTRRRGLWKDFGYAVLAGAAVISIVPVWSRFTTGRWTETPQALYTRTYIPWDKIGFGLDSTPPLRAMPANQAREIDGFKALHQSHTGASLLQDAGARIAGLRADVFTSWRVGLVGFFVLGLFCFTPVLAIGGITALLLFLAYLLYAHPWFWTVYYLEALPVVALTTVLGLVLAMKWLATKIEVGGAVNLMMSGRQATHDVAGNLVSVVLAIALMIGSQAVIRSERDLRNRSAAPRLWLWDVMARLPTSRSLLFVRDERNAPRTLVTNDIDPATVRTLLAHDLGDEDVRLGLAVRDRSAYIIDVGAKSLIALPPVGDSVKH